MYEGPVSSTRGADGLGHRVGGEEDGGIKTRPGTAGPVNLDRGSDMPRELEEPDATLGEEGESLERTAPGMTVKPSCGKRRDAFPER